jgi:hypothetical protein
MTDILIDLNDFSGGPHWLSGPGKVDIKAIRAKHRARHFSALKLRPRKPARPETMIRLRAVMARIEKLSIAKAVTVWNNAINILDQSEIAIRDVIERDLANKAGLDGLRVGETMTAATQTSARVSRIRARAIKKAFRYLRYELKNPKIKDRSLAQWAQAIATDDAKRIDNAIRIGLIGGLDNTEIARNVIGSLQLRGVDGVTEVTRQHVIRLGRAAVRPLIRKNLDA